MSTTRARLRALLLECPPPALTSFLSRRFPSHHHSTHTMATKFALLLVVAAALCASAGAFKAAGCNTMKSEYDRGFETMNSGK